MEQSGVQAIEAGPLVVRGGDVWHGGAGRLFALAILLLTGVAAWAPASRAQQAPGPSAADDRRYDEDLLERERAFSSALMSPFCPGRTMVNCPSPNAHAYREQFKRFLAQGVSEDTLRERFAAEFGEVVRSTPSHPLGAWILPILIVVAGAAAVAFALVRLRRATPEAAGPVEITGETEADLELELRKRGL